MPWFSLSLFYVNANMNIVPKVSKRRKYEERKLFLTVEHVFPFLFSVARGEEASYGCNQYLKRLHCSTDTRKSFLVL